MDLWICVRFAPPGVLEVPQLGRGGQGIQGAHAAAPAVHASGTDNGREEFSVRVV